MTVWVDISSRGTKKSGLMGGLPGLGSDATNRKWLVFSNLDDLWPHFFFVWWRMIPDAEPLLVNLYPEGVIFCPSPSNCAGSPHPHPAIVFFFQPLCVCCWEGLLHGSTWCFLIWCPGGIAVRKEYCWTCEMEKGASSLFFFKNPGTLYVVLWGSQKLFLSKATQY